MTDKELIERDSKRDLGAELLESVRQMKAGQKGVIHAETRYVLQNKPLMRQLAESLQTHQARSGRIADKETLDEILVAIGGHYDD